MPSALRTLRILVLAGVLNLAGASALAQDTQDPAGDPLASRDIERQSDAALDAEIEDRIEGIFSEIEALATVDVRVNEGVVTLTGEVPTEAAVGRAERLAARISGVVTIENRLERSLDVETSVSPILTDLATRIDRAVRAWPILLIALAVGLAIAGFGFLIAAPGRLWLRLAPNPFVAGLMRQGVPGSCSSSSPSSPGSACSVRWRFLVRLPAVPASSASRSASPCATRSRITSPRSCCPCASPSAPRTMS